MPAPKRSRVPFVPDLWFGETYGSNSFANDGNTIRITALIRETDAAYYVTYASFADETERADVWIPKKYISRKPFRETHALREPVSCTGDVWRIVNWLNRNIRRTATRYKVAPTMTQHEWLVKNGEERRGV